MGYRLVGIKVINKFTQGLILRHISEVTTNKEFRLWFLTSGYKIKYTLTSIILDKIGSGFSSEFSLNSTHFLGPA